MISLRQETLELKKLNNFTDDIFQPLCWGGLKRKETLYKCSDVIIFLYQLSVRNNIFSIIIDNELSICI